MDELTRQQLEIMPIQPIIDDFEVLGRGVQMDDCFRADILDAIAAFLQDAETDALALFAFGVYFYNLHSFDIECSAPQWQTGSGGYREAEIVGHVVVPAHELFFVIVAVDDDFEEDAVGAEGVVGEGHGLGRG